MFIWTLTDVIQLGVLGIVILIVLGLTLSVKYDDWKRKRRIRKEDNKNK